MPMIKAETGTGTPVTSVMAGHLSCARRVRRGTCGDKGGNTPFVVLGPGTQQEGTTRRWAKLVGPFQIIAEREKSMSAGNIEMR
jgi:hypothetical protein